MLPSNIVNQIKGVLPQFTDLFTNNVSAVSLTRTGGDVTVTTGAAHNLAVGKEVLIKGAKTPILIDSLTRVGSTAIALTDTPHTLTINDVEVDIAGADQSEYNGLRPRVDPTIFSIDTITILGTVATVTTNDPHGFIDDSKFEITVSGAFPDAYNITTTLDSIISPTVFTYIVQGADTNAQEDLGKIMQVQQHVNQFSFVFEVDSGAVTPATGTIYQVKEFKEGYNGLKFVDSVVSPTVFTYEISTTPLSPAQGAIAVSNEFRISAVPTFDMADAFYKTLPLKENWIFVAIGDEVLSRNILTVNDSTAQDSEAYSFKQLDIQPFNLFLFIPNIGETLNMTAVETAKSLKRALYKTLCGVRFISEISTDYTSVVPKFNGLRAITDAYYVHEYEFEATNYIYNIDIVDPVDAGVFRIFDFDVLSKDGNVDMEIKGRVDD